MTFTSGFSTACGAPPAATRRRPWAMAAVVAALCCLSLPALASAAPVTGAIFTTDAACSGVDLNIYGALSAVYLDGGPTHTGAAGLPDGEYYVKVTEPDGTLLGTSVGAADETPVVVAAGEFASCYELSAILVKASDASPGYDASTNPGGEYKVWVSTGSDFSASQSKTDNFKVRLSDDPCDPEDPSCGHVPQGTLNVVKYYDANVNGIQDAGETLLEGWKFNIHDGMNWDRYTSISMVLAPDTYTLTEYMPTETNWIATDPAAPATSETVTLGDSDVTTVDFGNVCLGAGGGFTLGFWSNKNGQSLVGADDRAMLSALNLVNANGTAFDPATNAALKSWLLAGSATNMAYMLSVQLAAMELNVYNGGVSGSATVYSPTLGFITINDLMAAANAALLANPVTIASGPARTAQEALKNALDQGNNNLNFVQAAACPYTFG